MAHQYGQQALEALKPLVDKTAYTATRTYTQEEREAMGENTDGRNICPPFVRYSMAGSGVIFAPDTPDTHSNLACYDGTPNTEHRHAEYPIILPLTY